MSNKHCIRFIFTLFTLFVCISLQAQRFVNLTLEQVKIDSVLPSFTHVIPLNEHYKDSIYTVELLYPEFTPMTSRDIARYNTLSGSILPNTPAISQHVVLDKKQAALHISFMPLALHQGRYQFLTSFLLRISSKPIAKLKARTRASISDEPTSRYATNSVLSKGKWAKIRVANTGVYQLTPELIRRAGFTDINKVKVFGYGGWLQNERLTPQDLIEKDDLKEVPTCKVGDKRLFFARGTVSWNSKTATRRTRNPYSDYGYYFITQTSEEPLLVDSTSFLKSFYPSFNDYHSLHEVDNYAWFPGGRNLFEATPITANAPKTYTLNAPKGVSYGQITVIITTNSVTEVEFFANNVSIGTQKVSWNNAHNQPEEFSKAKESVFTTTINNLKEQNEVRIEVKKGNVIRLDYISLAFNKPFPAPQLATQNFPTPEYVYNITPQNLHADGFADMVIIIPTSQKLLAQAKRLKAFHETTDKMRVRIVPADELYNEFSSGTPDANAYRKYLKMLYDRAGNNTENLPKYLVLFGDAAFDNRMNTAEWKHKNPDDYLLCYESENSFHKVMCYVDDGFYCLLDDGEGNNPLSYDKPDMAVGRFPVANEAQAKVMVDKLLAYNANNNANNWQNTIMFMGDDGNHNLHMEDAEAAANMIQKLNSGYLIKKVMWDAYKRQTSAQGASYPDVTKVIKEQQASGALIMDYIGHGIEYQISHENVLRLSDFIQFKNKNLPLWITASCDIMPFDGLVDNIGEAAVLNPNGGAVAFFGTTRTVYANYNKAINMAFLEYVLSNDTNGKPISVGEAQRLAKNRMIDKNLDNTPNKLQYSLLGDPALVLKRPTAKVIIDNINGVACSSANIMNLKAGEIATIKGHVEGQTHFNGTVNLLVRDGEETHTGLRNSPDETPHAIVYKDRTRVIFNGTDSIKNGTFSMKIAIPKDISYSNQKGAINVYAVNNEKTLSANGFEDNFMLNGSVEVKNDSIGPSLFTYLNTPAFINGSKVNSTPLLVVELADDNGINVSGNGIGHDLQLVIDNDASKTYNLNNSFMYNFGSYTKGIATFRLPELSEGAHSLKVKAWDILNNSSVTTLSFVVVKNLPPTLLNIHATENPAKNQTTFIINHDYAGDNLDLNIELFDSDGKLIWNKQQIGSSANTTSTVTWNLTSNEGSALKTGVYLYRVSVANNGGKKVSKTEKLIIQR